MRVFGAISPILPFCHFGAWGVGVNGVGLRCAQSGSNWEGKPGWGGANQRGAEFAPKLQGLPGVLAAR